MHRDFRLYLDDILDAIANSREYTMGIDHRTFEKDKKTRDAVVRNLEVIGEAAGRLPESLRLLTPGIEWRKIIGIRSILIHEYFGISLPVIWDVVKNKLDDLEKACREISDYAEPSD